MILISHNQESLFQRGITKILIQVSLATTFFLIFFNYFPNSKAAENIQLWHSLVQLLKSFTSLEDVVSVSESTNPDEAFPSRSKPAAGCRNHMSLPENLAEDIPRASPWEVDPDIWCIFPSIYLETKRTKCIHDYLGVFFVETNHFTHCLQVVKI